jgi:hypothetical protein
VIAQGVDRIMAMVYRLRLDENIISSLSKVQGSKFLEQMRSSFVDCNNIVLFSFFGMFETDRIIQ